jgi:protein-S-isoprenylcysteine O-methyltransferase Ste14
VAAAFAVSAAVAAIGVGQLGVIPSLRTRAARALLAVSSAAVLACMALAGVYALGEYLRTGWLSIPEMARTHGALNALGFALCGLLAWTLEGRSPGDAPARAIE